MARPWVRILPVLTERYATAVALRLGVTVGRAMDNKGYWESVGGRYNQGWEHPVMAAMSRREMAFVRATLTRTAGRSVLDIGIGNGRIIDTVLRHRSVDTVCGIDIAEEMVNFCRRKYTHEPRVRQLSVCDLAKESLCFDQEFDFVSAVRVLKYNSEWRKVLPVVSAHLRPGGLFLFTMPNRNSLNRYSHYPVPSYTTSAKEIAKVCGQSGLRLVEVVSFSKIPTRVYRLSRGPFYRDVILRLEDALEACLGSARFGRELFVVAERSSERS